MADKDKLLHYALENGIIDYTDIQCRVNDMRKEQIINSHTIWQGKNGRWYVYLPDGQGGRRQVSKKNREDLEEAILDSYKQEKDNPTITSLFEKWIAQKMEFGDILPATELRYRTDYKRFFSDFGKRRIRNISEMDIEIFVRSAINDKPLSRKAFGGFRTIVYGIFKSAKKQGYIDYNIVDIFEEMEIPKKAFAKKKSDSTKEVFYVDEESRIVKHLEEYQDMMNLGLLLIFKSGLRIGELVALKPSDISGNTITINKTETTYRENGKIKSIVRDNAKTDAGNRTVIIPDDSVWIIRKLRNMNPFGEWLFQQKSGERIRAVYIRKRLYSVCDAVGIDRKSPHKIRKTYGTKLMESKIPETIICEQMGHTDISCTQKYYYFNRLDDDGKTDMLNMAMGNR